MTLGFCFHCGSTAWQTRLDGKCVDCKKLLVWAQVPPGNPPVGGWPVLLFLHGAGGTAGAYAVYAAATAAHGFAGIAVSGPVETAGPGCTWPASDVKDTHEFLQNALACPACPVGLNRNRLFLCGFSQGATHAFGLLASQLPTYAGAIVLSPGEGPSAPAPAKLATNPRPLYVAFGQQEHRPFRKRAQSYAVLWRRRGWPLWLDPHPGSHHFPADWDSRLPRILGWFKEFQRRE
jgi:predicted esterase